MTNSIPYLQFVNQGGVVYSHTLINIKDTNNSWR